MNRLVARLARIVVARECRGFGLTRLLIDAICRFEGLKWLECSTSMAHYTPFLDRLGFREAPRPAHDIEAELLDWADRIGLDPRVAFSPEDVQAELDRLSVREARRGRQLIWRYYHRHVLYRRTKAPIPKNVPNASDDRWMDAFRFAGQRLIERPRYLILGPLDPLDQEPPPPDSAATPDPPEQTDLHDQRNSPS